MLIVAALFGAGIFKTNAITEPAISTAHNLHALCGADRDINLPNRCISDFR